MKTFRLWTLWTDRSEFLLTISAPDADSAIAAAVRQGAVSGLGADRRYIGIQAVEV